MSIYVLSPVARPDEAMLSIQQMVEDRTIDHAEARRLHAVVDAFRNHLTLPPAPTHLPPPVEAAASWGAMVAPSVVRPFHPTAWMPAAGHSGFYGPQGYSGGVMQQQLYWAGEQSRWRAQREQVSAYTRRVLQRLSEQLLDKMAPETPSTPSSESGSWCHPTPTQFGDFPPQTMDLEHEPVRHSYGPPPVQHTPHPQAYYRPGCAPPQYIPSGMNVYNSDIPVPMAVQQPLPRTKSAAAGGGQMPPHPAASMHQRNRSDVGVVRRGGYGGKENSKPMMSKRPIPTHARRIASLSTPPMTPLRAGAAEFVPLSSPEPSPAILDFNPFEDIPGTEEMYAERFERHRGFDDDEFCTVGPLSEEAEEYLRLPTMDILKRGRILSHLFHS